MIAKLVQRWLGQKGGWVWVWCGDGSEGGSGGGGGSEGDGGWVGEEVQEGLLQGWLTFR